MLLDSSQAFTSSFFSPSKLAMHRSPSFSSTTAPTTAVTMDCGPWDLECYGVHPFGRERGRGRGGRGGGGGGGGRRNRGMQRYRRPFGPMIFAPSEGQPYQHLQVSKRIFAAVYSGLLLVSRIPPARRYSTPCLKTQVVSIDCWISGVVIVASTYGMILHILASIPPPPTVRYHTFTTENCCTS